MCIEVHPLLHPAGESNVDPNGAQITDDGVLFHLAPAKQAQDAALELFTHCPAEVQPQPAITWMTQQAASHMWTRLLGLALVVLVNQVCYGIDWLWQFHGCLVSFKTSPALVR